MPTEIAQSDILEVLQKVITEHETNFKIQLSRARAARASLKRAQADSLTFDISILSLWKNEGEESLLHHRFTGTLEAAIKDAAQTFKRLVNRRDIQADWHIRVVVKRRKSPELFITVPKAYWKQYTDSVSRSS